MVDYLSLPNNPGCYIYKNDTGKIIYVGKAKNLKKRVASYFTKKDHDIKTQVLVSNIATVDFIVTENEIEALILENTLIKKHRPRYNIDLKDSKRYAYIRITDEEFPRLMVARRKTTEKDAYGPFVSGAQREYVLRLLRKLFKIRTCKRLPKRACLRHHIKLCDAPCISKISKTAYSEKVHAARMVLKGKTSQLIENLKKKMQEASEKQKYEAALEMRDQINSLKYLSEKQNMERKRKYDEDIINYMIKDDTVYLLLFNIYKGTLANKVEFVFERTPEFLEEFITQYYSEEEVPKELILPKKVDESIEKFLTHKRGSKVNITIPKIGEKKQLLDLAKKNVEIVFFGNLEKVNELKKKLRMNESPTVIECFDISHLSGTSTVASMVQFRNGKADKSNYRRFKIRTVDGIDDFASMAEVVRRRYSRLKRESQPMPNLIIVDGGKGQLSSTMEILDELNLRIPTIGIAKREEEIFFPGSKFPLKLDKKEKAIRFIQEIRDEAHRFAITYNRLLRKKKIKEEF